MTRQSGGYRARAARPVSPRQLLPALPINSGGAAGENAPRVLPVPGYPASLMRFSLCLPWLEFVIRLEARLNGTRAANLIRHHLVFHREQDPQHFVFFPQSGAVGVECAGHVVQPGVELRGLDTQSGVGGGHGGAWVNTAAIGGVTQLLDQQLPELCHVGVAEAGLQQRVGVELLEEVVDDGRDYGCAAEAVVERFFMVCGQAGAAVQAGYQARAGEPVFKGWVHVDRLSGRGLNPKRWRCVYTLHQSNTGSLYVNAFPITASSAL